MPYLGVSKILKQAQRWEATASIAQDKDAQRRLRMLCLAPAAKRSKTVEYQDLNRAVGYAAQFLWDQRVTRPIQAPATHKAQLLVLASTLSALVHPDKSRDPQGGNTRYNDRSRRRLAEWFWAATFQGYRPAENELETQRDALVAWAVDASPAASPPEIVRHAKAPAAEEVAAWRFGSRHHNAVSALLSRQDPCDLLTGERIAAEQAFEGRVDGHHLFPKHWAKSSGLNHQVDVVVNAAAITGYTNRWIGKRPPSIYLAVLRDQIGSERLSAVLKQHLAPEASMWADDWPSFQSARSKLIAELIAGAIGSGLAM